MSDGDTEWQTVGPLLGVLAAVSRLDIAGPTEEDPSWFVSVDAGDFTGDTLLEAVVLALLGALGE